MSYQCQARIFYPRFWLDAALDFLQSGQDTPPAILNDCNYKHIVSCFISYFPETAYGHRNDWYNPSRPGGG